MSTVWERLARAGGDDYAARYAARFRALADRGEDVHGEAAFATGLVDPPASVLDAGCGTGRVGIRLASLGYDVTGVDVDPTMLAEAEHDAPDLTWLRGDLSTFDLGRTFDLVLLAGNIVPLLEPGTLGPTAARLAAHVADGGALVCGFGLDEQNLPPGCPVAPMADVEAAFTAAGLVEAERWAGWDRQPWTASSGYVVTVHRADARDLS